MNKLFQNTAFIYGLSFGLILFIILNFLSAILSHRPGIQSCHAIYESGFPVTAHVKEAGFYYVNQFVWSGVIANATVALIASFIIGLSFKFIWSRITSHRLR
jgi:hypothetical protein